MKGTIYKIMMSFIDSLDVGETQRVSHTYCPAGEDTRDRLYVTRKPDLLTAYCHNCGMSSSKYMAHKDRYRNSRSGMNVRKPAESYTAPLLVPFSDKENIPAEADAWRIKSLLSRNETDYYRICYAPEWDAIYIPFFDLEEKKVGHQLRPLFKRGGAKYINFLKDKEKELGGIVPTPVGSRILVIVEDLVSAIHINRAGYDALVNYGTHVKPTVLYSIPERYNEVVVWLDNDNDVVIQHAKDMHTILQLYGRQTTIRRIANDLEPKHYTEEEIRKRVDNGYIRS